MPERVTVAILRGIEVAKLEVVAGGRQREREIEENRGVREK